MRMWAHRAGRSCGAALLAFGLLVCHGAPVHADDAQGPALKRGVNLSNWFAEAQREPLTARDFQTIKKAGFDHVRIPINPELLGFSLLEGSSGRVLFDFTKLDTAVGLARDNGLAVILAIEPSASFMTQMERESGAEAGVADLWAHIAEHFAPVPTSAVAFEILSEPRVEEARYRTLIAGALVAIRQVAPQNLVIIDVPRSAMLEGFADFAPADDPHAAYAFHYYEPFLFTHQGMKAPPSYGFALRYFSYLPYPSSFAVASVNYAKGAPDPEDARSDLAAYMLANWDAAHIAARIKVAVDWAKANHQLVLCTAFGAVRKSIAPVSRYHWIEDTRKALETANIGWTVWDYTDQFGITRLTGDTVVEPGDGSVHLADPNSGSRSFEPEALDALLR